jgi:hypothetical protein
MSKKDYSSIEIGDRIFLRVGSTSPYYGICARFDVTAKSFGLVPQAFWRPGKAPPGNQGMAQFKVIDLFKNKRLTISDLKSAGFHPHGEVVWGRQSKSAALNVNEGRRLDDLIDQRLS